MASLVLLIRERLGSPCDRDVNDGCHGGPRRANRRQEEDDTQHSKENDMSDFDLDATVRHDAAEAQPQITSVSLCTPGCQTGALACTTRSCNPTGGCTITK